MTVPEPEFKVLEELLAETRAGDERINWRAAINLLLTMPEGIQGRVPSSSEMYKGVVAKCLSKLSLTVEAMRVLSLAPTFTEAIGLIRSLWISDPIRDQLTNIVADQLAEIALRYWKRPHLPRLIAAVGAFMARDDERYPADAEERTLGLPAMAGEVARFIHIWLDMQQAEQQ